MGQPRRMIFQEPERRRVLRLLIFAAVLAGAASCAREPQPPPAIALVDASTIEIRNLPRDVTPDVAVHVGERATSDPPVAGGVRLVNGVPTFTPMFPLDPGRAYFVRAEWRGPHVEGVVRLPAKAAGDPVRVTAIQPDLEGSPENVLRLYVHFSGPMGRGTGNEHVIIRDAAGREVVDPFLPVDGEFWNAERTRYTLFFDPGRVKTGILPNEQMGRPLRRGRRYTLTVSDRWLDASGRPLAESREWSFTPGPAIAEPLEPAAWPIDKPRAGTRDPVTVRFPHTLDDALLRRALGIARDGQSVEGTFEIQPGARAWRFTPAQPWAAAAHQLVVLSILEDPSGNRIGRAFEVEGATRGPAAPERVLIPWSPLR